MQSIEIECELLLHLVLYFNLNTKGKCQNRVTVNYSTMSGVWCLLSELQWFQVSWPGPTGDLPTFPPNIEKCCGMNKGPINGKLSAKNARIMRNDNFSKLSVDKSRFNEFLSSSSAGCSKCGGEKAEPVFGEQPGPREAGARVGGGAPEGTRPSARTCVCLPVPDHALRTVVFHSVLRCEHSLILEIFSEEDLGSLCGTDGAVALLLCGELKGALVGPEK